MNEKDLLKLENRILSKIKKVKEGEIIPKNSEVSKDLNLMKRLDEPTYDNLLEEYKMVLNERQKK